MLIVLTGLYKVILPRWQYLEIIFQGIPINKKSIRKSMLNLLVYVTNIIIDSDECDDLTDRRKIHLFKCRFGCTKAHRTQRCKNHEYTLWLTPAGRGDLEDLYLSD